MDDLAHARYAGMRWNTPLSEAHAAELLDALVWPAAASVLDLGCGWGELLLRAVASGEDRLTGVGVDTDEALLDRGRATARQRGLADRVGFVAAEAAAWERPGDAVLCVGAAHAWGGSGPALRALRRVVAPGGRLLFGDGCWERPPGAAAAALFDEEVLPLRALVEQALAAGWRPLHLSTADRREWDAFELGWALGRQQWLLKHRADARAPALGRELDARLIEYLGAYRGELGFAYLILGH